MNLPPFHFDNSGVSPHCVSRRAQMKPGGAVIAQHNPTFPTRLASPPSGPANVSPASHPFGLERDGRPIISNVARKIECVCVCVCVCVSDQPRSKHNSQVRTPVRLLIYTIFNIHHRALVELTHHRPSSARNFDATIPAAVEADVPPGVED